MEITPNNLIIQIAIVVMLFRFSRAASFPVESPSVVEEEFNPDAYNTQERPDPPVLAGFEQEVNTGIYHTMTCETNNAKPAAEITWRWDGSVVNGEATVANNADGTFKTVSRLEIFIKKHHNGNVFRCDVINQYMEDLGELPLTISAVLYVKYLPVIDVSANNLVVADFEGSTVTLECTIDAAPEVTSYGWSRDFYDVTTSSRVTIAADSSEPTLRINSLTWTDKGYYRCFAENIEGYVISDPVRLDVLHKPRCRPHYMERIAVAMGTTGVIECHADTFPNTGVVFQLTKDGGSNWEYANAASYYQDDPNYAYATFTYNVSSTGDYKTLQFTASNGVGAMADRCNIEITAPGPAEAPVGCVLRNMSASSFKFECYEVFRGGSTAYYALEMAIDGYFSTVANSTQPYYTLQGLQPQETYFFRVCASNQQYWKQTDCSEQFSFTTLNGTSADSIDGNPPSAVQAWVPFVAGGVLLIILLAVIGVSILCIFGICKKEKEQQAQEVSLSDRTQNFRCESIPEVRESDDDDIPEVVYARVLRKNTSSANSASCHSAQPDTSTAAPQNVQVDISDLEDLYDRADCVKRKSVSSLVATAATLELLDATASHLVEDNQSSKHSSRRSSNASTHSIKSALEERNKSNNSSRRGFVVSEVESIRSEKEKDSRRGSVASAAESLRSEAKGSPNKSPITSRRSSVVSED